MARYTAGGTIDAGFGNGGVLTVTDNTDNEPIAVQAVTIDGAGRVLVGGLAPAGRWVVAPTLPAAPPTVPLAAAGRSQPPSPGGGSGYSQVTDLSPDPSGAVTAVGVGVKYYPGDAPDIQSTAAAVARYDANGAPVAGFGANGQELVNFLGPGVNDAAGVVVQPDGKVVTAIYLSPTGGPIFGEHELALVRYNVNGSLDTTFGIGGATRLAIGDGIGSSVNGLAVQPDGKILAVAAGSTIGSRLFRFNADGSPDQSFGGNGSVSLGLRGNAVTVDAQGRILVAGEVFSNGTGTGEDFAVARFNPNGSPDTTFGGTGEVTTDFNQGIDDALAIVVQTDGKIIAAGFAQLDTHPYTEQDLAVAPTTRTAARTRVSAAAAR